MPLGDWKQLAKERPQWIEGRRTLEVPWMDLETADEEAFFINVLVGEEEIEDLESIKKREEEELVRFKRGWITGWRGGEP
jgi:hypothetical protein